MSTTSKKVVDIVIEKRRKEAVKSIVKMGRPSVPEAERREKNKVSVYLNQEEMETVRNYVGDRSISDVIRTLVLDTIKKERQNEKRRNY